MAKLSPTGIAVTAFAVVGFGVWAYTSLQPEPTAEELENRSSLFGGPSTQETNDVEIERYGRTYSIWEGLAVEELDNREINSVNEFSLLKYDFDLGLVVGLSERDSYNRLFSELTNLEHIERVRLIGCEIAQQYFDRENTPDYNESPADVTAFHQRHCDIKP